MKKTAIILLALALALAALMLAGCTGGGDDLSDAVEIPPETTPAASSGGDMQNDNAAQNGGSSGNTAEYGLEIKGISKYAGLFVEDGTDETVSDVCAVTVRNNAEKTVQYAHLTVTIGETAYEFDVTTLPPDAEVQLLELTRRPMPESTDGYTALVTMYAAFDAEPGMNADALEITTQGQTRLVFGEGYRSTMYSQAILESADMFDILAGFGQLVLHSSYVLPPNGKAVLFSGPSGIGKSTQAALWQQYAGADVINGDRTLIRTDDLTANGVFYSGTSGICKNVTAPLRAIVLLDKADENTLRRAGAKEAFAAVLSQCSYYQWDAESAIHMTDLVAGLVQRADVYRLSCRADKGAVRLLQNELFGG